MYLYLFSGLITTPFITTRFLGAVSLCRKVHQLREENEVLKSPVSKVGAMMEANPTDHGTHFWNACLGPEVFVPKKILGILAHILRMVSWNRHTFLRK